MHLRRHECWRKSGILAGLKGQTRNIMTSKIIWTGFSQNSPSWSSRAKAPAPTRPPRPTHLIDSSSYYPSRINSIPWRAGPAYARAARTLLPRSFGLVAATALHLRQQTQDFEIHPDQRDEQAEPAVPFLVLGCLHVDAPLDEIEIQNEIQCGDDNDE